MKKIRIISALISLVLTPITLWLLVKLYYLFKAWLLSLTPEQMHWFSLSQVGVGVLLVIIGLWQWRRKKKANKSE